MKSVQIYHSIGVMSGTSLDGLDIALCRFEKSNDGWKFNFLKTQFIPYQSEDKKKLTEAYNCSSRRFVEINVWFGEFIGKQIMDFLENVQLKVDFISSHGHTVFHNPEDGYTSQIGSGAVIAAVTQIRTYSDFRVADVANGGQGAPLVPIGDKFLFPDYQACLNIGGFSNISYDINNQRIAYDISPANYVLNKIMEGTDEGFDRDGLVGHSGNLDKNLLSELNNLDFYKMAPPKTLGREWVDGFFMPILKKYDKLNREDLLRTLYEHISFVISTEILDKKLKSVLLTGGGAKNKFLVELLNNRLNGIIFIPEAEIIDFKEALVFSFLGVLRFRNEINCLSSVTGAFKDSIGGAEYL